MVYYTKKDTGGLLNGEEGRELAAHKYGADEWWLLLDPLPVEWTFPGTCTFRNWGQRQVGRSVNFQI